MGRVVIAHSGEAPAVEFPALEGARGRGGIRSSCVIGGPERPLFFWTHELSPGAEITWEHPPVGHVAYVWAGEVEANGKALATGGAAIVEHGGKLHLRAGASGAKLAHFHRRESLGEDSNRAGGNAHVVDRDGIFQDHNPRMFRSAVLHADSACPTCELYLQRSDIPLPPDDVAKQFTARHFHTVDEVMVVLEGAMMLGKRAVEAGGAVAIDAHTIYTFGLRKEKFASLNFRASDSYIVRVGPNNEPLHEPLREYDIVHDKNRQRFSIPG